MRDADANALFRLFSLFLIDISTDVYVLSSVLESGSANIKHPVGRNAAFLSGEKYSNDYPQTESMCL